MSWMTESELYAWGIKHGKNCKISTYARLYDSDIEVGDNVQIDDFCVLMGKIRIGSHVHIPLFCALYGKNGITMDSFSGLSPRCTVYTSSDDYSGASLMGSTIPETVADVEKHAVINLKPRLYNSRVLIKEHAIVGEGSILLAGSTLPMGCIIGAHSLVKGPTFVLSAWHVYAGNPVRLIEKRPYADVVFLSEQLLKHEQAENNENHTLPRHTAATIRRDGDTIRRKYKK